VSVLEQNLPASSLGHLEARFRALPPRAGPIPRDSTLRHLIEKAISEQIERAGSASDNELIVAALRALPIWLALDRHEILEVASTFLLRSPKGSWHRDSQRLLF
jgi:hypothetical protein